MTLSSTLGYPRIGEFRDLKKAVESFWKKEITESELQTVAKSIRKRNWEYQKEQGVSYIPSNDFSFYDQILDLTCMLGNVPNRFKFNGTTIDLDTYFKIARGNTEHSENNQCASEMTKWFDTNYHYIVPEFSDNTVFELKSKKVFDEFSEAKSLGINTRPVLVGPVTYLSIGKSQSESLNKFSLLENLLEVYAEVFKKLEALGATDIQIDEPIAITDCSQEQLQALSRTFEVLSEATSMNIHLTTYFGDLRENKHIIFNLPVESIHIDVTRGGEDIDSLLADFPTSKKLSIGIVNGRNIWLNNYENSIKVINKAVAKLGVENVIVSASCSLLHSPVTLKNEEKLDKEIKEWLSFADEKVIEITQLTQLVNDQNQPFFDENRLRNERRKTSKLIHNDEVKERVKLVKDTDYTRQTPFPERQRLQQNHFNLPLFPTTTIGSFPQTKDVRQARSNFKKKELTQDAYDTFLKEQIKESVDFQEQINMDVLVHGEFERNDMVEYFGEQLNGFAFTQFGWVQSYGSRCVKPPIIFGDVSRPEAMTVQWSQYAQSLTSKPMKGMLTGPVTILQWSFVRDDQPRKDTTFQIALAIRDEVCDLEKAGIEMIQIDEAALREGLPIRKADWDDYLTWSVDAFRLSTAGVSDQTQIHTHMCYSEFNDIIQAIARMDADVISIETSRSNMELLDAFVSFNYPNEIGPGVYDIHSPRVPSQQDMTNLIKKATALIPIRNIWVNPDCGLKTRGWKEVKEALERMVFSAKELREAFKEVSLNQ
ncbi:MAG: 5-methyltetrahydropteroyltriglutamate--homocysteine S-methyltransferase [Candidatus Margulisiibacteriota bacterium]